MKLTPIILLSLLLCSFTGWLTDFEQAKQAAAKKNRFILLSFSGSDWCVPCIRQKKEVFETPAFKSFAESNLVLINADFPRGRNKLSTWQLRQNEILAEKYDPAGKFPFTVLLSTDGKLVKEWEGMVALTPGALIREIRSFVDAGN